MSPRVAAGSAARILSGSMRPSYARLLALWAVFLAGCLSAPEPEDLLAVGFHTPEQTFRTFQTALRADLPDLEYRCLSSTFKERQGGVTQLAYREFRERLFEDEPWLKYAACAEIVQTLEIGRKRQIIARVKKLFVTRTFLVDFVLEDFYESHDEVGVLEGDVSDWDELVREENGALSLEIPMPQGVALEEIVELRAGREWKIESLSLLEGGAPEQATEPTP